MKEEKLKELILKWNGLQTRLRATLREPDKVRRAKELVAFLDPQHRESSDEALEIIQDCGESAWPVVQTVLFDEKYLAFHHNLIHVAKKIAGKKAIADLERIVVEEVEYWRVKKDDENRGRQEETMWHYHRLSSALLVLHLVGYKDDKQIVASMKMEWEAEPRLRHMGTSPGDRSPILKHADLIEKPGFGSSRPTQPRKP